MTTKRVVYRRSDGVVEVINPNRSRMAELMAEGEGRTEDEALAIITARCFSQLPERGFGPPEDAEVMEAVDIPGHRVGDREFRNALVKPGPGAPTLDMSKARLIHAARIYTMRLSRARELIEREFLGESVAVEKAALRAQNVQPQIDAAASPKALSGVWPAGLNRLITPAVL